MKKLFTIILMLFITFGSFAQKHKKLGFHFDKKTYNFGDVDQWNNQAAVFTFTNNTKQAVTILPIFSENDLEVVIPERLIAVGESVLIKAMYYTAGKGSFDRKFKIYFGSYDKPIYLRITGNIKSLSPEAYINCPMSKPELAKSKIELIGDVADIISEIPINEATIILSSLQSNKEFVLMSSGKGRFGVKLPVGNYFVSIKHPNYIPYKGSIYVGQTSPPLRIRLTPIESVLTAKREEPVSKEDKVLLTEIEKKEPKLIVEKKLVKDEKDVLVEKENSKKESKKNNGLDRNIDYVRNEPKDDLYTKNSKKPNTEVPNTVSTYKESNEYKETTDDENLSNDNFFGNDIVETKKEPSIVVEENYKKSNKIKKDPKEVGRHINNENLVTEKQEPKYIKEPKKDVLETLVPKNTYIIRVVNEKTAEPISNVDILLTELYKKQHKQKDKTDERGFSEIETKKNDYVLLATAKGFVSKEIKIMKDDNSAVFRVELTPVSDLYDDIYEAKKNEKEDQETLDKFSFGKTDFTFADDEKDKELEKQKNEEAIIAKKQNEESLKLAKIEKELLKERKEKELERVSAINKENNRKRKLDSLNNVITQINETQKEKEAFNQLALEKKEKLKEEQEQQKVDSLNLYIKDLLAKNNDLEKDLDKTKVEKDALENQQDRNKETIEGLNNKSNELEKTQDKAVLSKTKYMANNILFLIDVSTSMGKMQKIDMLKESIKNLSYVLRDIDRVAIVSYNQKSTVVLESVNGDNTEVIISAIDSLKTGGLTNGVRGLKAAYEMLEYYFIPGGNNQIILATDGLFSKYNNEMTVFELNQLVRKNTAKEMNLTVVGFGKDTDGRDLMTKLAKNGEGQYIQIQNEWMTKDVLIKEIQLNSKKVD